MRSTLRIAFIASLALIACEGGGGVVGIDDTGVVTGVAYVDRDGSGTVTGADVSAQGVAAALVLDATGDTVARATTRTDGTFTMSDIPVGRYRLVAALGTVGDTLAIEQVVDPDVSVAARDTAVRTIRLGYPTTTVTDIRDLPVGRRVIVAGIALNGWTTFADSTVHIQDATGVVRAVRVLQSSLQAGDSVRVLGSTGTAADHVVLADAAAQIVAPARGLPPIDSVGTGDAAAAQGVLENGQARVAGALVVDTSIVAGDLVLGVDDGSGRLEVVLDRHVQFNAAEYVPGATFSGAGVLVPGASAGTWRLKPRDRTEAVITFPAVTIAAARATAAGSRVVVQGLALNAVGAFGDSTLHVMDATGSIRAVRVSTGAGGTAAAGDSVRVLGTMTTRDGQPAITNATAVVTRAAVGLPAADSIATGTAAGAAGGSRDAAQVRIGGTIISSQTTNGDLILGVDDGSGR
ncbi:MAG TPA: carboxypeptidase-like regulatory domain-containing protein, partial [Longimicrobiales bacterium]|nr:carboxypeptidase-like regulatory domain-containing protein [Longimicrobiales bacterium]